MVMQTFTIDKLVDTLGLETVSEYIRELLGEEPKADATLDFERRCAVENKWWQAEVRLARLSEQYAVMWEWCYENGDANHTLIEVGHTDEFLWDKMRDFARQLDIPSGDGTIRLGEITYKPAVWHDIETHDE
jgi:hypothetical protein